MKTNANYQEITNELASALELFVRFFDEMPKGQLGRIVCDIGLLNDAFISSAKVLAKFREAK